MKYIKPIPVDRNNIIVGQKYFTCNYSGVIGVTVIKIFDDTKSVLVKTKREDSKPFVRSMKYIFDNAEMAKFARRSWEHDQRKQKKKGKR